MNEHVNRQTAEISPNQTDREFEISRVASAFDFNYALGCLD